MIVRGDVSDDVLGQRGAPLLGALLLLAALVGWHAAPAVFFAAWLAASWFALGIATGALGWIWIHRLTGGVWGDALRPHLLRLGGRMPRVLFLFLPVALGWPLLCPPFHAGASTPPDVGRALEVWHAPALVAARCAGYALVWLVLARRARLVLSSGEAAVSLMLLLVVISLASVDLLVALVPHWSSSIFGLLTIAGQAFAGLAAAVALACSAMRGTEQPRPEETPLSRDFGNLLLAMTMIWAYLSFMQLLIIWAENLPREISWYVPRLQTGWIDVGIALVLLHFALPQLALLFRSLKDRPARLGLLAAAMLAAHALDSVWLVIPSVAPHALAAWWICPLVLAGIGLIAFGGGGRARPAEQPSTSGALADVRA